MNKLTLHITFFIATIFVLASCTSGRWIVTDEQAVDRDEYLILEEQPFLQQEEEVTPDNPVLRMELLAERRYEYPEKVQAERNVQNYRLRPAFVALGLAGASAAFYAANSTKVLSENNTPRTATLNAAGGLMALSGFLNLKPVGEPRPTGEDRLLRSTGTFTEVDTVEASDTTDYSVDVTVSYGGDVISETQQPVEDGQVEIDLGNPLASLEIQGEDTDSVQVDVSFQDSVITKGYNVDNILLPYARVSAPITELRASPQDVDGNILAELVNGSQLQILDEEEDWYKVQYGISENYIGKEDTDLYWRSTEFVELNSIFALQQVPFGNVDVESNIPILSELNEEAWGLVVSNEDFGEFLSPRTYANRDGRLIATYFENAFGIPQEQLFNYRDITNNDLIDESLQEIEDSAGDSSTVFIYLNGYSGVEQEDGEFQFSMLYSAKEDSASWEHSTNLNALFERIADLPAQKKVVVADLDFQTGDDFDAGNQDPLESLARIITEENEDSAVLFASRLEQDAELYVSRDAEDKKHHIFTYYFARAIQQRNVTMATINQYLQRNVTFMSRKIYDKSQDPRFYGNIELRLIDS